MKNQKELAKIAINDKSDAVCLEAVNGLIDQSLLAEVAINSSKSEVGINAIAKIMEEKYLADVALHAKNKYNRKRAIERLTDQVVLNEISLNDEDNDVRKSALKKMNDNDLKTETDKNAKQLKQNETIVSEALEQPKPFSAVELNTLKDTDSEGIKIKNANETIVSATSAMIIAVEAVSKSYIQGEYDLFKVNTTGDQLLLTEGDPGAVMSFVFKTIIKWQEHLDWEDKGYKIKVNHSDRLIIHGFCKDFQGKIYTKSITLFKTDTCFSGWGDSDFQKLLREIKPEGLFVLG
jgi:hypothetical protein